MASETGTATDMEDFLTRIINFVTTDTGLTSQSPSQAWTVLRNRRDNLALVTTDFFQNNPANLDEVTIYKLMRQDNRTLNTDVISQAKYSYNSTDNGTHVTMQLRQAREVTSLTVGAPYTDLTKCLKDFRLQYSDDGSAWTTVYQATNEPSWTQLEERTYTFTSAGSHLYWRLLVDDFYSAASVGLSITTLQLLDINGDIANHFGSEVIFRAPGNANTDAIFTGIRTEYDVASDWHNFFLNGFTGFESSTSFHLQPGAINSYGAEDELELNAIPLWNQPMDYWLSANGRYLSINAKVSTNIESGYMGFIKTYAANSEYPYPLAIGGSLRPHSSVRGTRWRYSNVNKNDHSAFFGPTVYGAATTENASSTLYLLDPNGQWYGFSNRTAFNNSATNSIEEMTVQGTHPNYPVTGAVRSVWPNTTVGDDTRKLPYRECLGGGYLPRPIVLIQRSPYEIVFGEFDGLIDIPAFGLTTEDTTTFGADNYVLLQNTYRLDAWEFCAVRLD